MARRSIAKAAKSCKGTRGKRKFQACIRAWYKRNR